MAYKRRCLVCDADFETHDHRVWICSDDCREVRKKIKGKQYKQMERDRAEELEEIKRMRERAAEVRARMRLLSEDAKEASDHGTTYGKYKAELRNERRKGENDA